MTKKIKPSFDMAVCLDDTFVKRKTICSFNSGFNLTLQFM